MTEAEATLTPLTGTERLIAIEAVYREMGSLATVNARSTAGELAQRAASLGLGGIVGVAKTVQFGPEGTVVS